jgi:predicted enzyme related to lactoylglutathione lyase
MPAEPRLYRIILPVSDVERGKEFYTNLLGIEGRRVSPGRHYFDCGSVILAVFDPGADGDPGDAQPLPDHIYFAVADLEAAHQRALNSGSSSVDTKIETQPWGERCFYMKDPFGNRLCFVDEKTVFTGR